MTWSSGEYNRLGFESRLWCQWHRHIESEPGLHFARVCICARSMSIFFSSPQSGAAPFCCVPEILPPRGQVKCLNDPQRILVRGYFDDHLDSTTPKLNELLVGNTEPALATLLKTLEQMCSAVSRLRNGRYEAGCVESSPTLLSLHRLTSFFIFAYEMLDTKSKEWSALRLPVCSTRLSTLMSSYLICLLRSWQYGALSDFFDS